MSELSPTTVFARHTSQLRTQNISPDRTRKSKYKHSRHRPVLAHLHLSLSTIPSPAPPTHRYANTKMMVQDAATASASRQCFQVGSPMSIYLVFIPRIPVTSVIGRYTAASNVKSVARSACCFVVSESWTVTAPMIRSISSCKLLSEFREVDLNFSIATTVSQQHHDPPFEHNARPWMNECLRQR